MHLSYVNKPDIKLINTFIFLGLSLTFDARGSWESRRFTEGVASMKRLGSAAIHPLEGGKGFGQEGGIGEIVTYI